MFRSTVNIKMNAIAGLNHSYRKLKYQKIVSLHNDKTMQTSESYSFEEGSNFTALKCPVKY